MKKHKIMTVFGTRPEAIKMAPLIKKLEECEEIESIVCVTAQHREMLDQVLQVFDIEPDYDLNIMKDRQSLSDITINALDGLGKVYDIAAPDMVLVHGDTTTTFVGSLAAFYRKIPSGHVEAGLRTYDNYFPYPEEMNRKLTGSIADLHFSPTALSKNNLIKEGTKENSIFLTGNTVIDALEITSSMPHEFEEKELKKIDFKNKRIITVTAHRRENLGKPLENICTALKEIAEENDDVIIIYAVHLNPLVQKTAKSILSGIDNVNLINPLGLLDMHKLIKQSYLILTDSGGIQEEGTALGKPVLVMRNETERPEGVDAGVLKLVGSDKDIITKSTELLLTNEKAYEEMAQAKNPFGDGCASERIVEAILSYLSAK